MKELSLEEVSAEFFNSITYYKENGDDDDLFALLYVVHSFGYQRGFLDATEESNGV
tara:strand:- start:373 stop:540 length:168 start_codon:yes stop_codon:yes gene_type:complete